MKLFSGSSNIELAKKLAMSLDAKMGKVELSEFSNSELRVFVSDKCKGEDVVIVQSLSYPTERNLVEFCLLCDALARLEAKEIIAVIPWLGYSKQDKVFRIGEPLSVKVIAKLLQVAPIKKIYTFDLHNPAILGFFDIPVTNLSARSLFLKHFKKKITENSIVVAPDEGAVKNSTTFAHELGIPIVYIDKKRDLITGEVTVRGVSGGVNGREVLLVDDMIVTGSTLVETAKYLNNHGVKKISVAATHHLYVPGVQEKLEACGINSIVVTNTISTKIQSSILEVLDISSLIRDSLLE